MGRKLARESSMKLIYQMDLRDEYSDNLIEFYLDDNVHSETDQEFMNKTLKDIIDNMEKIDALIEENIHGWSLSRLSRVDLAILRVAVSEMLCSKDVPIEVIINEAIENAKKFSTDDSYKFINGVLGGIVNTIKEEEIA